MKCEHCNQDLRVSHVGFESEEHTTKVESVQTLVCVNFDCKIYSGTDLSKPKHIADTIRTEV